jgi:hypothetical protein
MSVSVEQVMQFHDESVQKAVDLSTNIMAPSVQPDQSFADYFKRPVAIYERTWPSTDAYGGSNFTIKPWQLWAQKTQVSSKLANFAFLRGNLHIKVMINSTPFVYGAALISYNPLLVGPDYRVIGNSACDINARSQRPSFLIYPQTNTGGEMVLPFFHPQDWLRVGVLTDFIRMGELNSITVVPLRSASDTVTGPALSAHVQVLAWMENLELSGSTVGPVLQAKDSVDEYNTGVISKPASAIADIAHDLEKTPVIGKFATAATIGARAVARISSLFGFSTQPTLADPQPMFSRAFPLLSTVGISTQSEKLSLDPKAALGVDPSIVGAPQDSLNLVDIAGREAIVAVGTWNTTDPVDNLLMTTRVTPFFQNTANSVAGSVVVQHSPMSWIASMFEHWRGDIIFRFRFVATQYHKGRVIISWDPTGIAATNLNNTVSSEGIVKSVVVDIGSTPEVEVRIPYHQAYAWLSTVGPFYDDPVQIGTSVFEYLDGKDNGTLTMRIFNVLRGPNVQPIQWMMSVRAAENFEVANPSLAVDSVNSDTPLYMSYFQAQSGDSVEEADFGTPSEVNAKYLLNFGEKISSLREIWQRKSFVFSWALPDNSADLVQRTLKLFNLPGQPGYGGGTQTAWKQAGPGSAVTGFTWSRFNYLSYIAPAFVGWKGSVDWTFNFNSASMARSFRVSRGKYPLTAPALTTVSSSFTSENTGSSDTTMWRLTGDKGSALTYQPTRGGVSVIVPFYSKFKFALASYEMWNQPPATFDMRQNNFVVDLAFTKNSSGIERGGAIEGYCAAGADFTPLFFLNVPPLHAYALVPIAN